GKHDYTAIAERFFTEEEADYVRDGDGDPIRFAKIWVRKEAFCKYTGKGLSDFANFSVSDGERFYGKINGIPIKKLSVSFPGSSEYIFCIVGEYLEKANEE
ncbi:MAG: 4'-phosphopantetheinyl transferase superfamily protein, partial [Clostridia bacterium]